MIRILGALGIGALAMYFFDPENGRRRRERMRDKAVQYGNEAQRMGKRGPQQPSEVDIDLSRPQP